MDRHAITDPLCIVIFGASGDLTRRKLVPALHSLNCEKLLSPEIRILGVARTEMTDEEFRNGLHSGVVEYARLKPDRDIVCSQWLEFGERISYLRGDYGDPGTYARIKQWLSVSPIGGNALFYLAMPPALFSTVIERLGRSGLSRDEGGWRRMIIEKPFGRDLASARQLNELIRRWFTENQVFRIDHYLGKETVQNLLTFRFGNVIFEPLWNRNFVDHVQIFVAEAVGIEKRASYYDHTGVIRDMLQNHLLQLLSLMCMEPPAVLNDRSLRDEKIKVLQATRPLRWDNCILGQYRGYRQETGVSPESHTPTFVTVKLFIDNWRWQGVPFYLSTGKKLASRATEISLQFKRVPHLLFPRDIILTPNHISFCIQPNEGIHLGFETKIPGAGMRSEPVEMAFHYRDKFGIKEVPDAYERLLVDAIQGDASLFSRSDEIEWAWIIVDPLQHESEQPGSRPFEYDHGTWGPRESDVLMARDFRSWHRSCACAWGKGGRPEPAGEMAGDQLAT